MPSYCVYFTIIEVLGVIGLIVIPFKLPNIYYPVHNFIMEHNLGFIPIVLGLVLVVVIPTCIVIQISKAKTPSRIKKHIRYLKAKNPHMRFENLNSADIKTLEYQLDSLANYKTGYVSSLKWRIFGTLGVLGAVAGTSAEYSRNRNKIYNEYLDYLMELHPEIDFYHPTIFDREVIEDELDVIMFARK